MNSIQAACLGVAAAAAVLLPGGYYAGRHTMSAVPVAAVTAAPVAAPSPRYQMQSVGGVPVVLDVIHGDLHFLSSNGIIRVNVQTGSRDLTPVRGQFVPDPVQSVSTRTAESGR
jgi:hypothetical protein